MNDGVDEFFDSHSVAEESTAIPTPTRTNTPEVDGDWAEGDTPWPGRTFIIRPYQSDMVLTLVDGQVKLCKGFSKNGGYHWECVEKCGWLGFRNCVSGTFLGHRHWYVICASNQHQNYCARRHPEGGYVLLAHNSDFMWELRLVNQDGAGYFDRLRKCDRWEFFMV